MKKLLSMVLSLAMVISVVSPAFAYDASANIAMDIQNEIQAKTDLIMDDVYRQLEEQDALELLDVYKEILEPQIHCEVLTQHGVMPMSAKTYNLKNGGVITYLATFDEYQPTEVVVTCLDRDRAYDFILQQLSFSAGDIIEVILGHIPYVSDISDFLFNLDSYCGTAAITSITKSNGYAQVINTYSREFDTSASVVIGWSTHPSYTSPDNSINHRVTYFPAYVEK